MSGDVGGVVVREDAGDVKNVEPKTKRGKATQQRLIEAAIVEFGQRGFHEASVDSITQRAACAQGTFYIYFASKEELFRTALAQMGQQVRSHLTQEMDRAENRLEAERLGLEAFVSFVRANPGLYRLVMEAQFVDEAAYQQYFMDFGRAYAAKLDEAVAQGEITEGPGEERAWAIMGISLFMGLRYGLWEQDKPVSEVVAPVLAMLAQGLAVPPKTGA
ncbi:TetR/AcrR family transcriptional regulator [Rhodovibrionaceae bacterium A322]